MPLDVQPLSPARRAAMMGVMLGLLAASLGFAQMLVRRKMGHGIVFAVFDPPTGARGGMPVNDNLELILKGRLRSIRVNTDQGPRTYVAFAFTDTSEGENTPAAYLAGLFETLIGEGSSSSATATETTLAGHPAKQLQKQMVLPGLDTTTPSPEGADMPSAFAIMRLAAVDDQIVAICFSGPGSLSEADKQSFEGYCSGSIHILTERPVPTAPGTPPIRRR